MSLRALALLVVFLVAIPPAWTWLLLRSMPFVKIRMTASTVGSWVWRALATIGGVAAAVTIVTGGDAEIAAAASGFIFVVYLFTRSLVVDLLRVRAILAALRRSDRVAALAAGRRAIRAAQRFPGVVGVTIALTAPNLLGGGGALEDAEMLASAIPHSRFLGQTQWTILHTVAIWRLRLGRFDAAEQALDACLSVGASPELEKEHRLLRALVEVATDRVERALGRVAGLGMLESDLVAAHAAAAQGNVEHARAALERIRGTAIVGEAALRKIASGHGPAHVLAAELVDESPPVVVVGVPVPITIT